MLVRKADNFKDYSGGLNQYVCMTDAAIFERNMLDIIGQ